jgi:hypothetical protein
MDKIPGASLISKLMLQPMAISRISGRVGRLRFQLSFPCLEGTTVILTGSNTQGVHLNPRPSLGQRMAIDIIHGLQKHKKFNLRVFCDRRSGNFLELSRSKRRISSVSSSLIVHGNERMRTKNGRNPLRQPEMMGNGDGLLEPTVPGFEASSISRSLGNVFAQLLFTMRR